MSIKMGFELAPDGHVNYTNMADDLISADSMVPNLT